MEKKVRDLLEEDFPESMIKQRRGRAGESLAYVGSPAFVQKLNDSFDSDWSFEIVEWKELHGEAVVLARITGPDGITKEQFGNSTISVYGTKHARAGEIISFGDDLKAAASDAMKKCATLYGVGLAVYGGEKAGIKKEEDPKSATLANIQKGEIALAKKLVCHVSDLRNNHFGVDGDIADCGLENLQGYEKYMEAAWDAEEEKPGTEQPSSDTDGGKGASEPVSGDVEALRRAAVQVFADAKSAGVVPVDELVALKTKHFGGQSYPADADKLTGFMTEVAEVVKTATDLEALGNGDESDAENYEKPNDHI